MALPEGVALNDFNDGTVLYIDPNDPQAAALLQQAGLTITEDGTVIGGIDEGGVVSMEGGVVGQEVGGVAVENPEVITPEQAEPMTESQLGSLMEGTVVSASAEVPQELFMNTEDIADSKENINLEAAAVEAAVVEAQSVGVDLANTLVSLFSFELLGLNTILNSCRP